MPYSATAIANYFLDLANAENDYITPMKIQKLIYIAHGWSLGLFGKPLVEDELPEAWDYGPVFPSLYYELRVYGKEKIAEKIEELNMAGEGDDFMPSYITPEVKEDDQLTQALLRKIWEEYKKLSAGQLVGVTHQTGTPWSNIKKKNPDIKNIDIPNQLTQKHYQGMANSEC